MILTEQIKSLQTRRDELARCLRIEELRIDLTNEEEKTQEPDFWEQPDRAREQLRKVASIKRWVEEFDRIATQVGDLELMGDFVREGVMSEAEMDAAYQTALTAIEELDSYLSGKTDAMDELAEPRHRHSMSGFVIYRRITAPIYS